MKTRFPKKLQGFLSVACITLMSGCGTFLSDRVGGFSGIEEDVRIVKEPFYWSLTLGLIPMAAIVSMPVDLAVDIVLYPFDVWLKNSLRVKDTPRPVGYSAPLYSINLTGGGDFDYAIWTYYDAPRNNTDFTKVTALQQPDSYTARAVSAPSPGGPVKPVAGVINPARLFSRYPYNSETTYSFHTLGREYQGAEGERYRNTTKIKEAKLAPVDDVTDKSIIIFFMPCNELVLVRSDVPDYKPEALQLPGVQSLYKKLKKQSSLGKCPVPASTDKVVVVQG